MPSHDTGTRSYKFDATPLTILGCKRPPQRHIALQHPRELFGCR